MWLSQLALCGRTASMFYAAAGVGLHLSILLLHGPDFVRYWAVGL